MIQYVFLDEAGCVCRAGAQMNVPTGAVELPNEVAVFQALSMMQVDGIFVARPFVPEPKVSEFDPAGRAVVWAGLPPATMAEISDVDASYTIATISEVKGAIAIELPDPGRYRIELTPPRPYLPMIIDIEVPA